MMYGNGAMFGGMHGLWWIFWLILLGVLVFAILGRPAARRPDPKESPHEILRRRLAAGEIDAEQYEQRKALLDRDSGPPG